MERSVSSHVHSLFTWSGQFLHVCALPFLMERSVSSCVCSPFSDGAVIDGDNPEHIRWIFAKATARADEHGICGVTYRLTQCAYHMSDCVAWLFFLFYFHFFWLLRELICGVVFRSITFCNIFFHQCV